jgi:hypothetical protein
MAPTDRELLDDIIRRLRGIEKHLGLTKYESGIGTGLPGSQSDVPVEPPVPPGPRSKPVNPLSPPPLLDPNAPSQRTSINPGKKP